MLLNEIFSNFILGLLTPLGAVCVLPLFPGFLAFLANQVSDKSSKKVFVMLGFVVALGVIVFMILVGLLFTTFLQSSLTNVVSVVSPIAFGILFLISLLLIFDFDIGKYLPQTHAPVTKNPIISAFTFGFFFGAIVLPCNPALIAVLFTRSVLVTDFASSMMSFIAFGIGMSFPLLVFSVLSAANSTKVIGFLTKHKRKINGTVGVILLFISAYYLLCVFEIFGTIPLLEPVCSALGSTFAKISSLQGVF